MFGTSLECKVATLLYHLVVLATDNLKLLLDGLQSKPLFSKLHNYLFDIVASHDVMSIDV